MPVVRVSMLRGKSPEYIDALSTTLYDALVEGYAMAEGDHFQIIEQLEPDSFRFNRNYQVQVPRTDNFVIITIQSAARRMGDKEAFMKLVVDRLGVSPGIAPQDVLLYLYSGMHLEDISFGNGKSAASK